VKYGFVAKHRGAWPVNVQCGALGVSCSGFYAWRTRPLSTRARTDAEILQTIRASFALSDSTYGAPLPRRSIACYTLPKHQLLQRPVESGQYTSEAFQRLLQELGVTCSMSRSGNVWDNSVMESFFSTMKIERCHRRHYATRQAARADIFDYIERFYNPLRRHSTLGNKSPVAFEQAVAVA